MPNTHFKNLKISILEFAPKENSKPSPEEWNNYRNAIIYLPTDVSFRGNKYPDLASILSPNFNKDGIFKIYIYTGNI